VERQEDPFERCVEEAAAYCHRHYFADDEGLRACLYGVMLVNELSPETHTADVDHVGFLRGSARHCRRGGDAAEPMPSLL
jgi:hypothetical protein